MTAAQVIARDAQRVRDLVRLAVDAGAAEAESRTAAFAACKLIAKHDLEIGPRQTAQAQQQPRTPDPKRTYDAESAEQHVSQPRPINAKFDSMCRKCGRAIHVGERCLWTRGRGVAHFWCWSAAHGQE